LVAELNIIESNERVEEGMKESAWHLQEVPGVPGRINAILPGKVPSQEKEKGVCNNFIKGGCTFGSKCKYVHDEKAREQGMKEIRVTRTTIPCVFFASGKGCRKGDRCEYLHEKKQGGASDAKPTVSVIVCGL